MTSSELRKKHHELEIEERKDRAESEFGMAMHTAEMEVKTQYLGFVKNNLVEELNAPERQIEMKNHAKVLVTQVLSGISGLSSVPRLSSGESSGWSTPKDIEPGEDAWLARVNERVEQERAARLGQPDESGMAVVHETRAERARRLAQETGRPEMLEQGSDEVEYRARRPGQS